MAYKSNNTFLLRFGLFTNYVNLFWFILSLLIGDKTSAILSISFLFITVLLSSILVIFDDLDEIKYILEGNFK